jgi:hypothetical protein
MSWRQIPTPPGKPEVRAQMDPLPSGPYVLIEQITDIKGMSAAEALEKYEANFVSYLPDSFWGKRAYAFENGKAVMVAYHFDTGD